MHPFVHAAPIEGWCILGSAIGGMLIGNSPDVVKAVMSGIGRCFKGSKYHKDDYLNTIFCVSKVMKTLKSEGAVALEAHVNGSRQAAKKPLKRQSGSVQTMAARADSR